MSNEEIANSTSSSQTDEFKVVGIASSAGGLQALTEVQSSLPADFGAPILVVKHLDPKHRSHLAEILSRRTALAVQQAKEGQALKPGNVFIAPPNQHLIVNADGTLSLTQSELVHFVRPSADL